MLNSGNKNIFPFAHTAAALSAVAVTISGLLLVALPRFSDEPGVTTATALMATVVWCSGLIGAIPLATGKPRSVLAIVRAYFVGAAARILICLVALAVMRKMFDLPAAALVVTLMLLYLPMLFVETRIVVRYIKTTDFPIPPARAGTPGDALRPGAETNTEALA